jgi:hypothetical protein
LLSSVAISLPAGVTSTFVVAPEAGLGTATMSVILLQSAATTVLYDRNATAELRVINGATDRVDRDVALDSQFSPPALPAVRFAEPSPYTTTPIGAFQINVTPVGNPGVLELDQAYGGFVSNRVTMLFTGPAGTLTPAFADDDGRAIQGEAKVRFANAATQFGFLDFVLTPPDADPNTYFAVTTIAAPAIAAYVPAAPTEYDLYLRQYGTATLVSGPTRISLAAGGIYGVLAIDGPDTATAEVRLFDDFAP